jgi:hypothetical protein
MVGQPDDDEDNVVVESVENEPPVQFNIVKDCIHILRKYLEQRPYDTIGLTPKFLETKNWSIAVWAVCVKKINFFSIFSFISQAFREYQARPIPTLYEPVANFCWKRVLSSFFLYFLRSSYMHPCG